MLLPRQGLPALRTGLGLRASWLLSSCLWIFSAAVGISDSPRGPLDPSRLKGVDLEGRLHRFLEHHECRGAAVVFLSTECPISNTYLPVLKELSSRYAADIKFFGVISDPATSRAEAARHREQFGIRFPVVFDGSGQLRRLLRPTHTPQVVVLTPRGEIVYSGRIDDRFSQVGRRRAAASVHDLANALAATAAGRAVTVSKTDPVGCLIEHAPISSESGSITFNRHIAPILFANCSECHRPGQAAPFSLLNYADASRHALQIAAVTQSGFMPPWHPVDGFGHFQNERRLTTAEIGLIQRWAKNGKARGDEQDRLAAPEFPRGWRLGRPDLLLRMDEAFRLPSSGPDIHQHFVLPTLLPQDRLVAAVEFRPGNSRVVHHASFYVDTSGAARKLAARSPDVGYGSFVGPGFVNIGALRSWLPGMSPAQLPAGSGQLLQARSDLVLEIHYQLSGKPERDRSMVGIHFAAASARQVVSEIQVMNTALEIPAGEARYRHQATYTLPVDVSLLDVAPHMHLLGREMKATARLPNGAARPLIWIKDWDFNWQGQYQFAAPIRLPKGTRIDVEALYDNSADNRLNPSVPPRMVRWGEQTKDEMGICHFHYTCDTLPELETMTAHFLRYKKRHFRYIQQRSSAQ